MRRAAVLLSSVLVPLCSAAELRAATVEKTYRYYKVRGASLEEIEQDVRRRGPKLESGVRHPGATSLEFKANVSYAERPGRCWVDGATVTVKAEVTLPRWVGNRKADPDTRLIWQTLEMDIKRHEEFHVTIAKNHAFALERTLTELQRYSSCERAKAATQETIDNVLKRHDREQEKFDRVESANFSDRLARLVRSRAQQMDQLR